MPYATAGKNAMLESGTGGGLGGLITHVSLHSTDPGSTGAGELAGGSPAYARKAVTWAAAASGQRANNGALTFDVPASTTVGYLGLWSAVTAGTFYGYVPLNGSTKGFGTAATVGDAITSVAHGLVNTDRVVVANVFAEAIPAGLTEGTIYFVVGATTDTFQLSLTSGGAAVDITTAGELAFQKCLPEVFAAQGQLTLPTTTGVVLDATAV